MEELVRIVYQEMAAFALENGLEKVPLGDLQQFANRAISRMQGQMSHVEAAKFLGVDKDTLHAMRQRGEIPGTPREPGVRRVRWLYSVKDLLVLKGNATPRRGQKK